MRKTPETPSPPLHSRAVQAVEELAAEFGPGLVTGAADDDPSGIATYSQAGAQFGYGLLWTMPLAYPLMSAVQLVSAHIGRVTGTGLARAFIRCFPPSVVTILVAVLLVANIFNIGADLSAMAASAQLLLGGGPHLFVIAFALVCVLLQLFVPYRRYAEVLKWLTMSLFAYVGVALLVEVDWRQALLGLIWPRDFSKDALLTVVAVLGTTISPYLFFWQSAQEAEEVATTSGLPLEKSPREAAKQFHRMRIDTFAGMAFSDIISLAIMISTAATLHRHGVTDIQSAAQAAQALRPIGGRFAFALFALGIIGTGLLAVPVLAGSAAFAVAESRGWKAGLEYKPQQAARFYGIIVTAMIVGVAIDWSNINPMKALFYSAVLNGVCSVPIMAAMMVVASRKDVMGRFTEHRLIRGFGWTATAVMAVASAAMLVTQFT